MKSNKIINILLIALILIIFICIRGIRLEQKHLSTKLDNLQNQVNDKINDLITTNIDKTNSSENNIIEQYSDEELRKLNVFLSSFSEVNFDDFSSSNYDDKKLITFAINHQLANNHEKAIKYDIDNNSPYIDALDIQSSIEKYFGFTVENQSVEHSEYYNEKYRLPLADGEKYINFTQVKEIYNDGDNLKLIGEVYSDKAYLDEVSYDSSWRYEPMNRVSYFNKEDIKYLGEVEAVVQSVNSNGNQVYKLLDYKVNMEDISESEKAEGFTKSEAVDYFANYFGISLANGSDGIYTYSNNNARYTFNMTDFEEIYNNKKYRIIHGYRKDIPGAEGATFYIGEDKNVYDVSTDDIPIGLADRNLFN